MKHYVLFKFKPGTNLEKVEERIWKTYEDLDRDLSWLNKPAVYRSCDASGSGADLMAVIDLDGDEYLQQYLDHPSHKAMAEAIKDSVAACTSFDHY